MYGTKNYLDANFNSKELNECNEHTNYAKHQVKDAMNDILGVEYTKKVLASNMMHAHTTKCPKASLDAIISY